MSFRVIRDIVIVRHSKLPPTDEEWEAYMARCERAINRHGSVRALVISAGGGPSAAQRGDVNDLFAGRPQKVAVLLGSRLIRGVVTALSWFNREIRAFAPEDLDSAFGHLSLNPIEQRAVHAALEEIERDFADGLGAGAAA